MERGDFNLLSNLGSADPRLREQVQAGGGRPRAGPAGPALPVHQLHRGSLGLRHPAAAGAAPHALRALLPGATRGPGQPDGVLGRDKAGGTAGALRAVDPGEPSLPTGVEEALPSASSRDAAAAARPTLGWLRCRLGCHRGLSQG